MANLAEGHLQFKDACPRFPLPASVSSSGKANQPNRRKKALLTGWNLAIYRRSRREICAPPKPKGPRPVGTTPIVAWHEVPGNASLERTVRRVRCDQRS